MRQHLIALFVVSAIGFVGLWGLDALYLQPLRAADGRVDDLSQQLDALREREFVARGDLAALGGVEVATESHLVIAAPDVSAATARFQEYARSAVAQMNGVTASSQVAVTDLAGGYSKVSVLLRMRFAEPQLLEFLRKVETDSPPVLVESLEVRPLPISGDPRSLDVVATLSGFYGGSGAP